MAEQWFYRMFGQDFGPIPLSELQELTRAGSVSSTDEVRTENSPKWVPAGTVRELGITPAAMPAPGIATAVASLDHPPATGSTGSDDWYCKFNGNDVGPIGFQVLLALAEHGRLLSDDELKLGKGGKWRRVGSISRLATVLPEPAPATKTVVEPVTTAHAIEAPKPVVASEVSAPSSASTPASPINSPAAVSQPRPMSYPPRPAYRPGSSSGWSFSGILKGPIGITGIVIVLAATLFAGWKNWPKSNTVDIQRYNSLKLLLDDIRANREAKSTDFQSIKKRGNKLNQEYLPTLRVEAVGSPPKQKLLELVRDHLPRMLGADLTKETWYEQNYEANLKAAAELLDIK
ncbi:MAG: GYF domain-containing protein [Planctomycetaceae bacterium]